MKTRVFKKTNKQTCSPTHPGHWGTAFTGQIEKVWWKMMQLQFYNLQHLIVNQKKLKYTNLPSKRAVLQVSWRSLYSMLSLLKLFLISKTQLMPKASKRLFTKSYYISSILKWILLIFCKIKNIFMHFKFIYPIWDIISKTCYYIPFGRLVQTWWTFRKYAVREIFKCKHIVSI